MKKLMVIAVSFAMIFAFSSSAFAANAVSQMATTKGGQHVAECAQNMDQGVSHCAKMDECEKM